MSDPPNREALRRRLYRPGAGPGDVEAFVAAQPAAAEPLIGEASRARRRSPVWLVVPAVLLLVAGVAAWGVRDATAVHSPAATPLPTATVASEVRAAFVRELLEGHRAGLRAWLAPAGVRAQESSGAGPGTVEITPPPDGDGGGRMTVYLVLASDAEAGWAPARLEIDSNRAIRRVAGRVRSGTLLAGIPAIGSTAYDTGAVPVRVLVEAPKGVRWGLAAVFEQPAG